MHEISGSSTFVLLPLLLTPPSGCRLQPWTATSLRAPVSALSPEVRELETCPLGLTFWGVIDAALDGNELSICFADVLGRHAGERRHLANPNVSRSGSGQTFAAS